MIKAKSKQFTDELAVRSPQAKAPKTVREFINERIGTGS